MAHAKAALTQAELARYAKAMRSAGVDEFRVEIEKPDGTKVSIVAGKTGDAADDADDIDAMIKGTSKNAIFAHRRFRIGLTIC